MGKLEELASKGGDGSGSFDRHGEDDQRTKTVRSRERKQTRDLLIWNLSEIAGARHL